MDFGIKSFFIKLEKKAMKVIIRAVARYYLKKPDLYELISVKFPTFKAGLFALMNEVSYLLRSEKSFRLTSLSIEVTNHCNLNCIMCPTATQMERLRGFIEETLFRKIIDNNVNLEFIFLFQWGEPFLHPRIFELIEYASSKNIRTLVTTNGTICSDRMIERLLDSGLERLTFSVDGIGPTYTQIRGFNYEQLKTNISKFKKARDLKKSRLKIDVSMVVFEKTEADINKFIDEWKDVADGVYLIPRIIPGIRKKRCREMWRGNLTILWDGRVVPCCTDFDAGMVVGDAVREDVSNIWNGSRMRELRRLHGRRIFNAICARCDEYTNQRVSPRFT